MNSILTSALVCAAALAAAGTAAGQDNPVPTPPQPLARYEVTPAMGDLGPLLDRAVSVTLAASVREAADAEDDERTLRRLRDALVDVLATEGYFSPRIEIAVDTDARARYLLSITPGPRTRVMAVELVFRGALARDEARQQQLRAAWELPSGQPFRDAAWAGAKRRLLARAQARDYAAARLTDSAADINVDTASASLRVEIDSGPAFTVGGLRVEGLVRYDRELVQRYNPFSEGDAYDTGKLLDFQRRLQASPYFATVEINVEANPERPGNVPIRVKLAEAKSKRVAFGAGFSTNTGPRFESTYRQALLFGQPYTLQSGLGLDRTRQVAYADIYLPPKPNGALDSFGVLTEHTDIENVVTRRWATGVARAHTWDGTGGTTYETRLSLNLQREVRDVRDGSDIDTPTNDVVSTTYTWTRRTVDSITEPRRGDILSLSGTLGLRRLGVGGLAEQTFTRAYGRYVRYLELTPRDQIVLRGEAGHVITDNPQFVPNEFLFRTGGAGSVRGYSYQSLGLREGSATLGSTSLVVGSAEYVRWLSKSWGAAAFYDVGDADDELLKIRWAKGYGAGARWRTVAGPLALDVAYGERVRKWRIHFAIAIAF